jgi:hypothetical protein
MKTKPSKINHGKTIFFDELVHPELVDWVSQVRSKGYKIYVTESVRGYCNYGSKLITIPMWVVNKPDITELQWYIAHEIAHAFNHNAGTNDHHGPNFMHWLKKICPNWAIHHELSYKPRNAISAGISMTSAALDLSEYL